MRRLNGSIIVLAGAQIMSATTRERRIEKSLVWFHIWLCGHIEANVALVDAISSHLYSKWPYKNYDSIHKKIKFSNYSIAP